MEKMIYELKIVETSSPMPSIEIDIDSTTANNHRTIIEESLVDYAEQNPALTASIYDYISPSVNFGPQKNSVFFVVAKSKGFLKYIYSSLKAERSIHTRYGDHIQPSKARLAYHIESGKAWRRDEEYSLTLLGSPDEELPGDFFEGADLPDVLEQSNKRAAVRSYKARSDASVRSIKSAIETAFGLPEGSVALCGPDGNPLRADAKIKTLRKRWETS